jgi:hypothetical protein
MSFQKSQSKKESATTFNREATPENKRKGVDRDDEYLPSPSQTPAASSNPIGTQEKKKKQKSSSATDAKKNESSAIPDPPSKARIAGKDMKLSELVNHPRAFQNIDEKEYRFNNQGKIHKLVDRDGQEVSFLIVGIISVAYLGIYGNHNPAFDSSLDRARYTILLQGLDDYAESHAALIEKLKALEFRQFGSGKDFKAEDKQLAVKPGNRILLKRRVWRFSDDLTKRPTIEDDPNCTLWADAIRSKKEPSYFPNGCFDYTGASIERTCTDNVGNLVDIKDMEHVFKEGTTVLSTCTMHLSYFGKTAYFQIVPIKMQVLEKTTDTETVIEDII